MHGERFTVQPGTRLLHIGPYKTGTTALQGAFHRARRELTDHGVLYAGRERQAKRPAVAITRNAARSAPGSPAMAPWEALCAEAAAMSDDLRMVVSSEFFSDSDDTAAREAVRGLRGADGEGVHVVVTLRPLLRILPSHWQQYVKHGLCDSYEEWLDGLLRRPSRCSTPEFWHRHRHDALLERWARAAGADNITVVVVDDAEPQWQFRVFEELLGLPEGLLEPEEGGVNRSLTQSQAELLLRLNRRLAERPLTDHPREKVVREGVVPLMQDYRPSPGEPRIITPGWAQREAAEVAEEMVADIRKSGVRVIGDLATLTPEPDTGAESAVPETVPLDAAVAAVLGGIAAGPALARRRKPLPVEERPVGRVPAGELLRVVRRRGLRRLRRRLVPGGGGAGR
ncbi:hypothetical protein [Streptomyces sp. CNQ085]|uniref:hypothetical protein n=1 Tax=Streptomyces sp. CNQ085 TaxID=2886944 RepID=UPI001F504B13|nr:hypothetical protein [Streptomyces sp. CNQ085]MCI0384184.1 hypothetical protein [Streptomyces sp. CNQ085]